MSSIIVKTGLRVIKKMAVYHSLLEIAREVSLRTSKPSYPHETENDRGRSYCGKRTKIKAGNTKKSDGNPQRGMQFNIMKCHWSPTRPAKFYTILPESIREFPVAESSQEMQFLLFVIVWIYKIARWHNVSHFPTLYFCS